MRGAARPSVPAGSGRLGGLGTQRAFDSYVTSEVRPRRSCGEASRRNRALVSVAQLVHRHRECIAHVERITPDATDHDRAGHASHCLAAAPRSPRRRGPRRTACASSGCRRASSRAPRPPAMQHSARPPPGRRRRRRAPSRARPARTASRSAASARACSSRSTAAAPAASRPRSFSSSEPASAGANGPTSAIASPSARAKPIRGTRAGSGSLPTMPDDRGRVDRALGALVVERDVAAHDRHAQRQAGVAQALDRALELPGDVRLLGVAEVEAVGQAERLGAHAGEVARALEHRLGGARVGVAGHAPAVAVDRDRDRARVPPSRPASGRPRRPLAGRRTVREPTSESYCSKTQRLRGDVGRARAGRAACPALAVPAPRRARRVRVDRLGGLPRARGRRAGSRRRAPRPACRPPARRRRARAAGACR